MNAPERSEHDDLTVRRDPDRFLLLLDDEPVGHARYSISGAVMTIPYVETVRVHRGKDFAARLMRSVLDEAREHGLTVAPHCGYAAAYMRRRRDTHDLFANNS